MTHHQPNHMDTHYRQADALAASGRLDEAESVCQAGLSLAPQDARLHFLLATIFQRKGKLQDAAAAYEHSLREDPANPVAQYNLGLIRHQEGRPEDAERCFREAVRLNPRYFKAHNNLGSLLLEKLQYAAASACYRQALRLMPDSLEVLLNLSTTLGAERKYKEAVEFAKRAVDLGRNNVKALIRYGTALNEAGDAKRAVTCFRRALKLDPDSSDSATMKFFLASHGHAPMPNTMPKELIQSLFDGYAGHFDQHLVSGLHYQVPAMLYGAVVEAVGAKEAKLRILDLGCGTGMCGVQFRHMASHLVGVDLAPKMIAKSKERGVYDELLLGDISVPLRAPAAAYDLILAGDVFIYVGELAEVFRDCQRVLAPGGLFAFSVEAAGPGESLVLHSEQRYAHSPEYLRSLAREVGFEEVRMDEIVVRMNKGEPIKGYLAMFRQPA